MYVTIIHVSYLPLLVLLLKINSIFAFFSTCILFYFFTSAIFYRRRVLMAPRYRQDYCLCFIEFPRHRPFAAPPLRRPSPSPPPLPLFFTANSPWFRCIFVWKMRNGPSAGEILLQPRYRQDTRCSKKVGKIRTRVVPKKSKINEHTMLMSSVKKACWEVGARKS